MTREIKAIFDCRGIGPEQVALFMADGKRVLVDKKQYFREIDRESRMIQEEFNVREFNRVRKPRNFRSGLAAKIERAQAGTRSAAPGKRISLRQANNQRPGLFN